MINKIPKTGLCYRRDFGQYFIPKEVIIRIDPKQKWKYTVLDSARVVVERKNVVLYMSRFEFNQKWVIIEDKEKRHWQKRKE